MAGEPLFGKQPIDQHLLDLRARRPLAGWIEPSLGPDGIEENLERPLEPAVTEIVEAGEFAGAAAERLFLQHGLVREAVLSRQAHRDVHRIDEAGTPRRTGCRFAQSVFPVGVDVPAAAFTLVGKIIREPQPGSRLDNPAGQRA